MSFVSEFKEFAMKGSVVDLAVGVVIGGAFGKIVASLVGDVIMPPLSPPNSELWAYAGVISIAPPGPLKRPPATVQGRFCAGNRRGL